MTPLRKLADLVNLRLAYFVILFFLIAIIGEGTGVLSNVFVSIFGFLYPGYMTFRVRIDHIFRHLIGMTVMNVRNGWYIGLCLGSLLYLQGSSK